MSLQALEQLVLPEKTKVNLFPRLNLSLKPPLRILIVTDTWLPHMNGVIRTLQTTARELSLLGHQVRFVTPEGFPTIPFPTYPDIRLALWPGTGVRHVVERFKPQAIHIATEGPLGLGCKRYCLQQGLPFTTSFHTRFPDYLHTHISMPKAVTYRYLRWFHDASQAIMVSTPSLAQELEGYGFQRMTRWTRGVDTGLFHPIEPALKQQFLDFPRPIMLYVGRIAPEKNIKAFLDLDLPGTKLLVGDGPQLEELKRQYPQAIFAGEQTGPGLAKHYAASDVLVFPSRTDTFGLVILEALASGLPVASFPVPGPQDILTDRQAGCMDKNLETAILKALELSSDRCRELAQRYSWTASAQQFINNLVAF